MRELPREEKGGQWGAPAPADAGAPAKEVEETAPLQRMMRKIQAANDLVAQVVQAAKADGSEPRGAAREPPRAGGAAAQAIAEDDIDVAELVARLRSVATGSAASVVL